jgi:hypothetical protein
MSEQTSNLPPPIPAESELKEKRKWSWWKITLAAILAVVFILKVLNSYNPIQIEVRRTGGFSPSEGNALEILNVGSKPIKITSVTFNERDDCRPNPKQ